MCIKNDGVNNRHFYHEFLNVILQGNVHSNNYQMQY